MIIQYVVLTRLWSPLLHGTCKKDEVVQTTSKTTGSSQTAEAFSYCPLIHSGFGTSSVVFSITEQSLHKRSWHLAYKIQMERRVFLIPT